MTWNAAIFWILAVGAVGSALGMVTRKSAVPSALLLVLTFCFLGGIYLTLNAQFLAVVQVAVYAGAIMVLVLFVIMLLNLKNELFSITTSWKTTIGVLAALGILGQIVAVILLSRDRMPAVMSEKAVELGTVESVGTALYTSYSFPFEMASIILIAAAVGAIVLAKKRLTA
jgi:NADH-quinone oxidoreductase subunit J